MKLINPKFDDNVTIVQNGNKSVVFFKSTGNAWAEYDSGIIYIEEGSCIKDDNIALRLLMAYLDANKIERVSNLSMFLGN